MAVPGGVSPDVVLANFEAIGNAFCQLYYQAFDMDRKSVLPCYEPTSFYTFEGHQAQGPDMIATLMSEKMLFKTIQHVITKVDTQPTFDGRVMAMVTGQLKTDEDHPHAFSEMFILKVVNFNPATCALDCKIIQSMFRLSLHNG